MNVVTSLDTMIKMLSKVPSVLNVANGHRFIRRTIKVLSSPQAVATLKLAVAVVSVFQTLDAFNDASRQIGFKVEK